MVIKGFEAAWKRSAQRYIGARSSIHLSSQKSVFAPFCMTGEVQVLNDGRQLNIPFQKKDFLIGSLHKRF